MKYALIFVFAATSVFAADAPPTVTLTQPELQAIISADAKVNEAFAPKLPADPKNPQK